MYQAEILGSVVAWLFVYRKIISGEVYFRGKSVCYGEFHELGLYLASRVGCIVIHIVIKAHVVSVVYTGRGGCRFIP
jgi:hypothetical protein